MDSKYIEYTGGELSYIPVAPNTDLQTILIAINAAFNTTSAAPNYSGYSLACVTQTDGVSHPTNTQNFAEGISKILCDFKTAYTTFTGTTYVSDKNAFTTAISSLQNPAYTYVPFSITGADTITTVWAKSFAGFSTIISSIIPTAANWATLSITPPTTTVGAWNSIIAYEVTQNTAIATKEATIGTFNNSANCLTGGATDSPRTTIGLLTTFVCTLPTFDHTTITWLGVASSTTLQGTVQNIINSVSGLLHTSVNAPGTGLILSSNSGYTGQSLSVDTTWNGLYGVKVDSGDSNPGFLANKLFGGTGINISIGSPSGSSEVIITNTLPETYKLLANSSDTTPDTLINKIVGALGQWGIGIDVTINSNNSQIVLTPDIQNVGLFSQAFMSYVSSDPVALQTFANLVAQAAGTPGVGVTNLIVTLTTGTFVLTWTHQSGISQNAKWRVTGDSTWRTNSLTPADPLSSTAITTTCSSTTKNAPLQFQVDTIYANGTVGSNTYEMINYSCQSLSSSVSVGVISVNQLALTLVDNIEYRLILNAGSVLKQTIITTGNSPQVVFGVQPSGAYHVDWRYSTTVNGNILYSDDASQLGGLCTSDTITIP